MASLFDAINAAAAALSADAEVKSEKVKSEKSSPSVKPRVQPKAAVTNGQNGSNGRVKPKQPTKPTNPTEGAAPKAQPTAQPKTDTPKQKAASKREQNGAGSSSAEREQARPKVKGGASYVIPAEFKLAIETYLNGRADMKAKLSAKGKSIDGCCDYIFDVMRKRAEKQRGGKSAVGLYAPPDEIFGLAVHYYDETDEALKSEK